MVEIDKAEARAIPPVSPLGAVVITDALAKKTAAGQREEYSRVGHDLSEASWHVHLAGFCSRDEAEAALAALVPFARKGE